MGYLKQNCQAFLMRFVRNDDGGMTVLGLYIFMAMTFLGAIAVDMTQSITARTNLQVAAEQAAHAALYQRARYRLSAADSKTKAIELTQTLLKSSTYGDVITPDKIEFGVWDHDTRTFTADPTSMTAVRVRAGFTREGGNPLPTFLFKMIGYTSFNVTTSAVYDTYEPGCSREGFLAHGIVDVQSNNSFADGFCLHSNTWVSMNNNNSFEPGTIVSMTSIQELDMPQAGFESNDGLYDALRNDTMNLHILNDIDDIILGLIDPLDNYYVPSYIVDPVPVPFHATASSPFTNADATPGYIYILTCNGGGPNATAYVDGSATTGGGGGALGGGTGTAVPIREVVIVSACGINLQNNSAFEDVIIGSANTGASSISGSQGLRLGANDNCRTGGGTQVLSLGSMSFAAGLEMYGTQLLAAGDISFTANATGVQGAALVANGEISGTSNMAMGFCGGEGLEASFLLPYFRMVK